VGLASAVPVRLESLTVTCRDTAEVPVMAEDTTVMIAERLRSNRSVDSDTLRQGAARRRRTSCTVRPLAATCRSPSRCTGTAAPSTP